MIVASPSWTYETEWCAESHAMSIGPSLGDVLDMHGQTEEVRASANVDTPMLQSVYTPRAYTSTMGPLHVLDLTSLI